MQQLEITLHFITIDSELWIRIFMGYKINLMHEYLTGETM